MRPEDFEHLQSLLLTRAGFDLTRDRVYLADHRLGPVARREGYASVEDLLKATRDLPVGSFSEVGTNVPTGLLRVKSVAWAKQMEPA